MAMLEKSLVTLLKDEDGQGMVEYALILAVVSVAAIATLGAMGTSLNDLFGRTITALAL